MENEKKPSLAVLIGCCIHVILAIGFSLSYVSAYALIPDTYGIGYDVLGVYTSAISIIGVVASLISNGYFKKFTLKGALFSGVIFSLLFVICIAAIPGKIGLLIALCISGFMTPISGYAPTIAIVSKFYGKKSAPLIGVLTACGGLGLSLMFKIAGIAFSALGVKKGFIVLGLACAAILLLNVMTLLRKAESKEEIDSSAEQPVEVSSQAAPVQKSNIYKKPSFYMFLIAMFLAAFVASPLQNYATVLFTNGGLDYSTATTILSGLGFAGALAGLVSGKFKDKVGLKKFVLIIFGGATILNILAVIYTKAPSTALVIGIILFYAIGYVAAFVSSYFVYEVYNYADALNAYTKGSAALSLGLAAFAALFGNIIEAHPDNGLGTCFVICTVAAIACIVLYLAAIALESKNNKA